MHCVALPRVVSGEEPTRNLPKIAIYGRGMAHVVVHVTVECAVIGHLPSYQWGDSNSDPRRGKALMAFVLGPRALPGLPYSSWTRWRSSRTANSLVYSSLGPGPQ